MAEPLILIVSLWVDPACVDDYIAYEREAVGVMATHGGRIERVIRLDPAQRSPESPFEIHVVSFPSEHAFDQYRSDPRWQGMSARRQGVILRTTVERGSDVQIYAPPTRSPATSPHDRAAMDGADPSIHQSNRPSNPLLERARAEAARLGHPYVGTEHQLLGILLLDDPAVGAFLTQAHLESQRVRQEIEATLPSGTPNNNFPFELPLTSRAAMVMRFAEEARRSDGSAEVMPIHIFSGILMEEENIAAQVLRGLGVSAGANTESL